MERNQLLIGPISKLNIFFPVLILNSVILTISFDYQFFIYMIFLFSVFFLTCFLIQSVEPMSLRCSQMTICWMWRKVLLSVHFDFHLFSFIIPYIFESFVLSFTLCFYVRSLFLSLSSPLLSLVLLKWARPPPPLSLFLLAPSSGLERLEKAGEFNNLQVLKCLRFAQKNLGMYRKKLLICPWCTFYVALDPLSFGTIFTVV